MSAGDVLSDLLRAIRNQFYADSPRAFFQQRDALLLCLTRPAQWFSDRGILFPPARYSRLLLDILQSIKRHGATGEIRWFPGYLGKAVEQYLIHNGDELYREAKAARNLAEIALSRIRTAPAAVSEGDVITPLVLARQIILQARKKSRAKRPAEPLQSALPGL